MLATPDAPMLVPAVARIVARFGRAPRAVTADRGYGEATVDASLEALGVKRVVIPRKDRPGAVRQGVQRTRSFRKLVEWRTGSEAHISGSTRPSVVGGASDMSGVWGIPGAGQGLCELDGVASSSSGAPLWCWTLRACASCWSDFRM